ncbi:HORMA domain-containing protein 1 isoform 3-T3 [Morphnus guianensis]
MYAYILFLRCLCQNSEGRQELSWLYSAGEMLRMIVLAVYTHPEDPQTITECYHFKFKYTHKGPLLDFSSKNKRNDSTITCADTKKASVLLIRKIYILMQNLSPLPNDVFLTMKLFYYDEVTPSDYQPPGFKEGECEGMIFEGEPMYLNVGEVPTPFHMLKVKVTTEKQRMENVDKSILKHGETDVPLQVLRVDRDDPEEENQDMNEDLVLDNKVEDRNNVHISETQGNVYIYFSSLQFVPLFPDVTKTKTQFSDIDPYIKIYILFSSHTLLCLYFLVWLCSVKCLVSKCTFSCLCSKNLIFHSILSDKLNLMG